MKRQEVTDSSENSVSYDVLVLSGYDEPVSQGSANCALELPFCCAKCSVSSSTTPHFMLLPEHHPFCCNTMKYTSEEENCRTVNIYLLSGRTVHLRKPCVAFSAADDFSNIVFTTFVTSY